ncbi:MAG: hypothetical protein ACON4C_07405 [Henriciella sp.]
MTISGAVTYDFVPHQADAIGLDYEATTQRPVRGVTVEAVNGSGTVLDTDVTTGTGTYAVTVPAGTDVRIQVEARYTQTTPASWDVRVIDNTNNDAPYVLAGSLSTSGTENSTRNLNAASGWTGTNATGGYTATRSAAPFVVLDSMVDAIDTVVGVDPDVALPLLNVGWSENNRPTGGSIANGDIGSSSYRRVGGVSTILILGAADNDPDEYDRHVNVHEFGHFLEDRISRSDSIGGSHSLSQRLDPRVAFGEGFGNAFSAIGLLDPIYKDSGGVRQQSGFSLNIESNLYRKGWYSEASVQTLIYDIFDTDSDGVDTISAGFGPIYNTLTAPGYVAQADFTMVYPFADRIRNDPAVDGAALDALLDEEFIFGRGPQGAGETTFGQQDGQGNPLYTSTLPVYHQLTVDGPAVEICSIATEGHYNKLGNRAYLALELSGSGTFTFTMTNTNPPPAESGNTDPDFLVWDLTQNQGVLRLRADSGAENTETSSPLSLPPGSYRIEAYDWCNTLENAEGFGEFGTQFCDPLTSTNNRDSCYDFTVTTAP